MERSPLHSRRPDDRPTRSAPAAAAPAGLTERDAQDALAEGLAQLRAGAHRDAEATLSMALDAVRKSGRGAWRLMRLDLATALGDVHRQTGHLASARVLYDEAIALAEVTDERGRLAELLTSAAQVHQGLHEMSEAERLGERAIAVAIDAGRPASAARALLTSARIKLHTGRVADAASEAHRALEVAREAEDPTRLADALALVGYLHTATHPRRLSEGVTCLHESIALLSELEDRGGLLVSYMLLGHAQLTMGDYTGAARTFAIARWIGQDTGNRSEEGVALINLAVTALELGRLTEASDTAQEALALAGALASPYLEGLALAVSALSDAHRGRLAPAVRALARAEALAEDPDHRYMAALVWQWAQEARLLIGDAEGALRCGEAHAAIASATGAAEGEPRAHALMAETLGKLGRHQEASRRAQAAFEASEAAGARGDAARAMRVLADLAHLRGDRGSAREYAAEAVERARRLGSAYQAALAEALLAELLAGKPEARKHLAALSAIADEMGCGPLKARAVAGLGDPDAARRLLDGLLEGADATARQTFMVAHERRPVRRASGTGPLNPEDLP